MGTRRRGREILLQLLYQVDFTSVTPETALQVYESNFTKKKDSWDFAVEMLKGIIEKLDEIDALIERQSENWKLGRMAVIDRNILRLAVYELLYRDDIPSKATLNEAIELGKKFGSEESGAFINGILDKIYRTTDQTSKNNECA